jgi:multidrug efflux pump subunit AcrA (membrane-fusion protein)
MSIPDLRKMIVNTGIPEALLAHVRGDEVEPTGFGDSLQAALLTNPHCLSRLVGQFVFDDQRDLFRNQEERKVHNGEPVRIQLNAFPDQPLHGHVKRIANVPLVRDFIMTGAKIYPTEVEIDEPLEGLKPGMTAELTIYASEPVEHVLAVPEEALFRSTRQGEMGMCFVLTSQGPEEREVEVGRSSEALVEIKSGVAEDEEVVLNPQTLLHAKETADP